MSNSNLNPSLRAVVAQAIAAAIHAPGDHATGVVDMGEYANIQLVGSVGAFGSGASGTVKFQQSKTADFSESKDIEGRDAVVIAENKPVAVDLNAGELDVDGDYQFVRGVLTAADGTVAAGLVVLGFDARHAPAEAMSGAVVDSRAS